MKRKLPTYRKDLWKRGLRSLRDEFTNLKYNTNDGDTVNISLYRFEQLRWYTRLPKSFFDGNMKKRLNNNSTEYLNRTWMDNGFCLRQINIIYLRKSDGSAKISDLESRLVFQNVGSTKDAFECREIVIQRRYK